MWSENERQTLYSETFGSPSSNTALTSYTGFSSSLITPTSSVWKVGTGNACGLTGSSGSGNVYSATSNSEVVFNFGNSFSGKTGVKLNFNYFKGSANGNACNVCLYLSKDGGANYESNVMPSNTSKGTTWYSAELNIASEYLDNFCIKFSNSANNTARVDDIVITADASTEPFISAEDLKIGANATSNEFSYTLSNPDGSTLIAAKKEGTGDWLTDVTLDENNTKVSFSTTVNDNAVREGYIVLTYGSLTKEVKVTQNGKSLVIIEAPEHGTLVMIDKDNTEIASGSKVEIGTVLTAIPNPADGYKFKNWQALDGSPHTYTSTFNYTVIGENVTFKANFEAIVYYTVTWSVNGVETTESVEENTEINFVDPTENIPSGYSFMGWHESELAQQNDAPTYVTSATATKNVMYYAVFAKENNSEAWVKLSIDDVKEGGVYAIITTDGYAFNGTIDNNGHGSSTSSAFTFDSKNVAESAPDGTCELTLTATGNGYTMFNASYGYLYAKAATSGNLDWHNNEDTYWMVYGETWEYYKKYSNSYARLRVYNNTFRTYSSKTNGDIFFAHKTTVSSASDFRTSVTESVNVSAAGYATYVSDNDLDYTNVEGLEAFSAQVDNANATVSFTKVGKVKAGEGVLLKANGGSYNVPVTSGVDANADNDFIRGEGTAVASEDNGKYNYILNNVGDVVAFYAANGQNVATNRAYLQTTTANARISLNFDDETTTGIIATLKDKETNSKVYNLNGQRVDNPAKGLYIVNGKKVIIK